MATKNRIVYLMQYLQENSDENHPVTTAQIREEMARKGCPIIISTLRDDIESLRNAGYDIQVNETEGLSTTYSWLERKWDVPELQILIDAVCSAQFIPKQKSRELIKKLVSMAGPSHRDTLEPRILISEHIKAKNKDMIYTVQAVQKAIKKDRKISFKYLQYNFSKEQGPKHQGTPAEDYIVSPYATVWNNDRYYLVGWSDCHQEIRTYRIDRMKDVTCLRKKRVPEPSDFNVQDYTDRVFWMFTGSTRIVTLRCRPDVMDQVIDKFGPGVAVLNVTKDSFDIMVPVSVSVTFFAWVFQFAGQMKVIDPPDVCDMYVNMLQKAQDEALEEAPVIDSLANRALFIGYRAEKVRKKVDSAVITGYEVTDANTRRPLRIRQDGQPDIWSSEELEAFLKKRFEKLKIEW